MRQLSIALGAIYIITVFSVCAPTQEPVAEEIPSIEAEVEAIKSVFQEMTATEESGDIDDWISFFSDRIVLMPPNESIVEGSEALRNWGQPYFEQFNMKETITLEEVEVFGDWAFARGNDEFLATPKAGGEALEQTFKFLSILQREKDGSWTIARYMWNSNNP